MQLHQDEHQKEKVISSFECVYCGLKLDGFRKYRVHVNQTHKKEAVKCKVAKCGRYFKLEEELKNHFHATHAKKLKKKLFGCALCDYRVEQKCDLIPHLTGRHFPKTIKCPKCPRRFASNSLLKVHQRRIHVKVRCPSCQEMCSKSKVTDHNVTVSCSACDQQFQCTNHYKEHKAKCTAQVTCLFCKVSFDSGNKLMIHLRKRHSQS
ncbi:replication initiator 1-like [Neocloeon triangulifer]|uniref:replication initiator 1-like n=1 Tax=Neocloeon triangulifer TaxID=2078957 RepID=UPI00286F4BB8|nr:replication initiator 1-like [Neocloeon triangulifer]